MALTINIETPNLLLFFIYFPICSTVPIFLIRHFVTFQALARFRLPHHLRVKQIVVSKRTSDVMA